MQEIYSSNPPVVTGICDSHKSQARHHRSLKLGSKLKYLDWPKYVDENLKHEIEFIIKSNVSFAENKIKNETEQLLLNCKHGNNIHEQKTQQNE